MLIAVSLKSQVYNATDIPNICLEYFFNKPKKAIAEKFGK